MKNTEIKEKSQDEIDAEEYLRNLDANTKSILPILLQQKPGKEDEADYLYKDENGLPDMLGLKSDPEFQDDAPLKIAINNFFELSDGAQKIVKKKIPSSIKTEEEWKDRILSMGAKLNREIKGVVDKERNTQ